MTCKCRTPGVGIQRNTCMAPLRAVCRCECHLEDQDDVARERQHEQKMGRRAGPRTGGEPAKETSE